MARPPMMLPFPIISENIFHYQKCTLNNSSFFQQKMVHTTMKSPPTKLVDDLVVEILSRVPAKSLMRFQCVSKAWLAFTCNIYYRKKLPATISGLFYTMISTWNADTSWSSDIKYLSLSADRTIDTTLSFLPHLQNLDILSMDVETIPRKERPKTVNLEFYLQDFDYFDIVPFHPDLDVAFLQVGDDMR